MKTITTIILFFVLINTALFSQYKNYKAVKGDTLYAIAFKYDMNVSEFLKINNIENPNTYKLKIGEILKVKDNSAPSKKDNNTLYELVFDEKTKTYAMAEAKTVSSSKTISSDDNDKKETIYTHTVTNGDTLYGIAFKYDMNVSEFLKINNIENPNTYKLQTGDKLKVYKNEVKQSEIKTAEKPTEVKKDTSQQTDNEIKTYVVVRGDTLSEIAYRQRMPLSDLYKLNDLEKNYILKIGDKLKVYNGNEKLSDAPKKPEKRETENYKVVLGDTLSEIAVKRDMELIELYAMNNLNDKYILKAGDILKLYKTDSSKPTTAQPATTTKTVSSYTVKSGDTLYSITRKYNMTLAELTKLNNIENANTYKLKVSDILKVNIITTSKPKVVLPKFDQKTIELAASDFIWPYKGSVKQGFGVGSDRLANRGLSIAGVLNENVISSDSGTVEYADRVRGYGIVVIIKHDNDYTTSYAHLSKTTLKAGDTVKKGETIGFIGDSGFVDTYTLYFKISYQGRPIDPMRVLPKN